MSKVPQLLFRNGELGEGEVQNGGSSVSTALHSDAGIHPVPDSIRDQ